MIGVDHSQLGRKGIAIEPFEQFSTPCTNDVDLGTVHVGIDKARQDETTAVIESLEIIAWRLRLRTNDSVAFDQQPMICPISQPMFIAPLQRGFGAKIDQITEDCAALRHGFSAFGSGLLGSSFCGIVGVTTQL
jgi:hypothetical protein